MSTVTFIYPDGPNGPTLAQMKDFAAVHVQVAFAAADPPVDVIHNFNYKPATPPPALEIPLVVCNPVAGGLHAPMQLIAFKDGNTITVGRVATGPETEVTYDIWIIRHTTLLPHKGLFGL